MSRKILKLFTSTYSHYSHLQKYRKTNQLIGSKGWYLPKLVKTHRVLIFFRFKMWLWIYTKRMWYHFLPHPAFQNRKATESWVEPESDLRLLLSSLIQSLGLGMRLPAKAPKINWVWIHTTCTSSAYSGCTIAIHMCKSNNQANCYSFPLHHTTSSLLHAMHYMLRLAPQCNAFC